MKSTLIVVQSLFMLLACSEPNTKNDALVTKTTQTVSKDKKKKDSKTVNRDVLVHGKDTLVRVDYFNAGIYWDLKYATADNFMKRKLYDTLQLVYVQKDVALRLSKIQDKLSKENANYHLLVYDGMRPLSVQWEMWNGLDTIPVVDRGKFVSNPKNGSVHNYAAAVDITICTENKEPLDMGAGYDDIRKIAYPIYEDSFHKMGLLSTQQIANRQLLRKVMRSQGFLNIPAEWWHFNAYPRQVVKQKYLLITKEL